MFWLAFSLALASDSSIIYLHTLSVTPLSSFPSTALTVDEFNDQTWGLFIMSIVRIIFVLPLAKNAILKSRLRFPALYNWEVVLMIIFISAKALLLTIRSDELTPTLFLSRQFCTVYLSLASCLLQLGALDHLRSSAPSPPTNTSRLMYRIKNYASIPADPDTSLDTGLESFDEESQGPSNAITQSLLSPPAPPKKSTQFLKELETKVDMAQQIWKSKLDNFKHITHLDELETKVSLPPSLASLSSVARIAFPCR